MKRPIQFVMFIALIIIALCVVRIGIENSISTTGVELSGLQKGIESYKKSNVLLEERYLKESSLTTIATKAKERGFIAAKSQMYLSTPLPLALKQ